MSGRRGPVAVAADRQPTGAPAGMVRAGAPLPTRQRRPGYAVVAVLLVVGFAAVGAYLYGHAGAKTPVVVVVGDVPAGHPIARSDVSTVAVAGAVTAIAGDHIDSVVGQTAVVHLLPDMLLQRSMIASGSGLSASVAQVGVVVKSGQIPAGGLAPGDVVEVVALPAANATSTSPPTVLVAGAQVYDSRADPAQAGGTLLTLVVPRSQAVAVAAASGAGQIALIRVGP